MFRISSNLLTKLSSYLSSNINKSLVILCLTFSMGLISSSLVQAAEKSSSSGQQIATLTVNLNTATAEELADVLTGVGIKKAIVIINYRDKNGPFKSIEQLLEVKGIGSATFEKNRKKLKL